MNPKELNNGQHVKSRIIVLFWKKFLLSNCNPMMKLIQILNRSWTSYSKRTGEVLLEYSKSIKSYLIFNSFNSVPLLWFQLYCTSDDNTQILYIKWFDRWGWVNKCWSWCNNCLHYTGQGFTQRGVSPSLRLQIDQVRHPYKIWSTH